MASEKSLIGHIADWWESQIDRAVARSVRFRKMEGRMATVEEFIGDFDAFTNSLSDEVDGVIATLGDQQSQIDDLKAQLAAGNTQAVSDALDQLAPDMTRLKEISAKLREAGTNPDQPIPSPLPPAPEPEPTPES